MPTCVAPLVVCSGQKKMLPPPPLERRVAGPICILLFGALTQICSVLLADCYIIGRQVHWCIGALVHWCIGALVGRCRHAVARHAVPGLVLCTPVHCLALLQATNNHRPTPLPSDGPDGKINNTYSEVVASCFGRWAVIGIGL